MLLLYYLKFLLYFFEYRRANVSFFFFLVKTFDLKLLLFSYKTLMMDKCCWNTNNKYFQSSCFQDCPFGGLIVAWSQIFLFSTIFVQDTENPFHWINICTLIQILNHSDRARGVLTSQVHKAFQILDKKVQSFAH